MVDNPDGGQIEQPGVVTPTLGRPAGSVLPRWMPPQGLIALGAAAIFVSLFLPWLDLHVSVGTASLSRTGNATRVPVQFLFDKHETANDPTILIVLIPAAALSLLGAVLYHKILVFVAGGVALFVAGMYAYQVDQSLGAINKAAHGVVHLGLNDLIGIGPYVCAGGALFMIIPFTVDRRPGSDVVRETADVLAQAASSQSDVRDAPPSDAVETLRQLADLRDAGVITPEQFEAKREELLRRI